jgi:hypothetical protein
MSIIDGLGCRGRLQALRRAHAFALEELITVHGVSCDLRWALVSLVARSLLATLVFARVRITRAARATGRHLAHRLRFTISPADTMVAAGGR